MRAIISVANRDGVVELARELQSYHSELFSTSGTLAVLQAEGITTQTVSVLTHSPKILSGRVKTLHPAILGGALARRDIPEHEEELQVHDIGIIDVVVVNLYTFAE